MPSLRCMLQMRAHSLRVSGLDPVPGGISATDPPPCRDPAMRRGLGFGRWCVCGGCGCCLGSGLGVVGCVRVGYGCGGLGMGVCVGVRVGCVSMPMWAVFIRPGGSFLIYLIR
jgi:hypothetical protein